MMFGNTTAIVGLALGGIAFISIILAIGAIRCYRSNESSMDAFLLSVFMALFLDCGVLVGVQAALVIQDIEWTKHLCRFYIWAWVALRFVEILSVLALSVDRVFILHLPTAKYKFKGTISVKITVLIIWIFASFMGVIPIVGWSGVAYYKELNPLQETMGYTDNCYYVSYEIDHNYGVFIIITTVALFFSSILCLVDVHLQMRYYKSNTLFSIESIGHLPTDYQKQQNIIQVKAGLHGHVTEFRGGHQVALAHENCRLACIIAFVSYLLNHVPYTVISLIGILTGMNSEHARVASLWFVLLDAIILPQTLWLFNTRYRAAYKRIWNGLICREPFCCSGKMNAVTLEGYLRRDEVPEIAAHGHLMCIKHEDSAIRSQRSTSEPNLSDVFVDSIHGPGTEHTNTANGFPRTCSLDSHLDEPVADNSDGTPSVAEREIQMSDAIEELRDNDSNLSRGSRESFKERKLKNEVNEKVGYNNRTQELDHHRAAQTVNTDVELHSRVQNVNKIMMTKQKKSLPPPTPPPRKHRKQRSLSKQSSQSSVRDQSDIEMTFTSGVRPQVEKALPDSMEFDNPIPLKTDDIADHIKVSIDPESKDEIRNRSLAPRSLQKDMGIVNESGLLQEKAALDDPSCDTHVRDPIPFNKEKTPSYLNGGSPSLRKKIKPPLAVVNQIRSESSSISGGVAYEDQDIDSILDKLSVSSTLTETDGIKTDINTIQLKNTPNAESANESDKENTSSSTTTHDSTNKHIANTKILNITPSKKRKVSINTPKKDKQSERGNQMQNTNAEDITEMTNRKFKMKHRMKLDKAQQKRAKYNQTNILRRAGANETCQTKAKLRPNTNSLDRDALKAGEYFNAGDVCDFEYSPGTSVDTSSQENDTTFDSVKNVTGTRSIDLDHDDNVEVWIPMKQSQNIAPIHTAQKEHKSPTHRNPMLLRQNATEQFKNNEQQQQNQEEQNDSPWILRTELN